jgi:protein involved in polysaccharide export with SLBB domain/capsular polysaccharide biosynthesis protein
MILAAVLLGAAGAYVGFTRWQANYTANVQLLRFEAQNTSELFKPREFTEHTFASLLRSPELLGRVSKKSQPPISVDQLAATVRVLPVPESDVVSVSVSADTAENAVRLANLYAAEAEHFTKDMQAKEAAEANDYLKQQLAEMDSDVAKLNEQWQTLARRPAVQSVPRASALAERLQKELDHLSLLERQYTDAHPLVIAQRSLVADLRKQLANSSNEPTPLAPPTSAPLTNSFALPSATASTTNLLTRATSTNAVAEAKPGADPNQDVLLSQLQNIGHSRLLKATQQREAQQYAKNPTGYCRILAMATPNEVIANDPRPKIIFLSLLGAAIGFGGTLALVLLVELFGTQVKTRADLKRISRLPVLGTLGNLKRMKSAAQRNWAFRTWTTLQSKLSLSPNHGLVCGITSCAEGEGRSTWVNMLARAATECGFRVLTIAAIPSHKHQVNPHAQIEDQRDEEAFEDSDPTDPNMAITSSVLSSPAQVTEKLVGENPQPLVHIPLPGWVWNLERRKQWQTALNQWAKIDNIVILVELPPACEPETVLLAENLPNLIWLADSGKSDAAECREQLNTLRDARCNLVGSVLNHEPAPPLKKRFARWTGCMALLIGLDFFTAHAQEANPPVEPPAPARPTNLAFSANTPGQRAAWQQRFTLGPGDVLNLGLFGQPELTRLDVLIGPDGRVSYLQAQDITAGGLTIDELRVKLDEALAQYYRTPRTIVIPVAYRSKKYYVLGKVTQRGVFTLDRPLTIIEAVARAHGLETGLLENQNSVDLADLQRSFLMRGGKRVPVNFEKLFQTGDLSQNVTLEPDDYLYFAAANLKEVYVLGEVRSPGPVYWTANTTVMAAIAGRSGFTDRAYKSRVAVVRGSLDHPLTYVVNVWDGFDARSNDFTLEPKDIIYVHYRPFIRVEELLDIAATAFMQSATAAWVGESVPEIIKSPFIPTP